MDLTADEPLTCPTKPPTIEGVGAVQVAGDPAYLVSQLICAAWPRRRSTWVPC